jgi:ribosomal protein S18 acetylase RimI-like enzyme
MQTTRLIKDDIPQLIAIHRYGEEMLAQKRAEFTPDAIEISDETLATDFMEWIDESQNCFLAAKEGIKIVGFVLAMIEDEPDDLITLPRVLVHEIAVHKDARHKGIGKALLDEVEVWARTQEIGIIHLNVWEFNEEAKSLYEKQGYKAISMTLEKIISP